MAISLLSFILLRTGEGAPSWGEIASESLFLIAMFSFPMVGVLIASRQPRNPIGWILLAIGLVWELGGVIDSYVHYGFVTNPGSVPRPDLVAVLASSSWVPGVGLIGTFVILLFPDGRLPSPRWRPLAWLSVFALTALSILIPVTPDSLAEVASNPSLPNIPNPLGLDALRPFTGALLPLLPLCMLGCASSLIWRFRRSRGRERLQLKWLASGAGVTATIYLFAMAFSLSQDTPWSGKGNPLWLNVLQWVAIYSFVLIPAAVGVAILRHRLYDIDLIINRALVYGALTAALASAYVVGVVGVGGLLRTVSDQQTNNLAVAASTLAVAAMFRPARGRIQAFIDRRFYRRKYDAEQTLETFSARLRARSISKPSPPSSSR
ncbi:MAG: hypothetical protein H0V97_10820 [Actinobacteria bacterium]|nr:hypothetical protein [Actinomycetota bacterium]